MRCPSAFPAIARPSRPTCTARRSRRASRTGIAKPLPGVPDSAVQALSLDGFATIVRGHAEIEVHVRLSYTYNATDLAAIAKIATLALPRIPKS